MSQLAYISSNNIPKISGSSLQKDWNEYQHLSTKGRYIEPKIFSGFGNQQIKLTRVKKQLYNPKLPTIRRIERDDVLCRLSDEHCHQTTSFTAEQFQNIDQKKEESLIEFSGLNLHNTGKTFLGVNGTSCIQHDSSLEFGARLRSDKSQKDSRASQTNLYQSPALVLTSSSAPLIKTIKYNYGTNTFDQNSKTRFHLNTKILYKPTKSIFRSSRMHMDLSANPWNPIGNNDGTKSS